MIKSIKFTSVDFTRTVSKNDARIVALQSSFTIRKGTWTALVACLTIAQNLPALAEDLPPDTVKRSVALATPKSVSPNHSSAEKSSNRSSYNRKSLKSAARSSYPKSHLERGFYLKQKNDLNGALIEFLNATQENPHLVKGFYEQALIFRERGYRKLAESALEQALSIKPDFSEARVLLATIRLEQGNFGGAVQELSKIARSHSNLRDNFIHCQ